MQIARCGELGLQKHTTQRNLIFLKGFLCFKVCSDDDVWNRVYLQYHKEPPSDIVRELARTYSWKRVFFTSKLKLQVYRLELSPVTTSLISLCNTQTIIVKLGAFLLFIPKNTSPRYFNHLDANSKVAT